MIALLSAPSNLGLRPPQPGAVPGAAKAPEALREAGLHRRLLAAGGVDAGVVLPGRYVDDDPSRRPGTVRNQEALVAHARRLADRLAAITGQGRTPLVLGGDCSLLVGVGLANARNRHDGLVHVDGHTDFRHPGNSDAVGSVAGEDLAAAVGLHLPAIADLDGLAPYFDPRRTVHIGCRDDDEHLPEVRSTIAETISASALLRDPEGAAERGRRAAGERYWLQVDVDVLDPAVMPAVDSPDPGGLPSDSLVALLRALAPGAIGASVTVFDPDLDSTGEHAALLADVLGEGLAERWDAAPGGQAETADVPTAIRPASEPDLDLLAAIEDAADRRFVERFRPERWDPAISGRDRAAEPGLLLVAAEAPSGPPVGFVHVLEHDGAHLEQLAVLPESGRRGHGRALVAAALAEAARRGHRRMTLRTYADVPWNAPFYARLGFTESEPDTALLRGLVEQEERIGLGRYGRRVQMTAGTGVPDPR